MAVWVSTLAEVAEGPRSNTGIPAEAPWVFHRSLAWEPFSIFHITFISCSRSQALTNQLRDWLGKGEWMRLPTGQEREVGEGRRAAKLHSRKPGFDHISSTNVGVS
jgi:hypothetical protein